MGFYPFVAPATGAATKWVVVNASGDATGAKDTAAIQTALLSFGTLAGQVNGAGGVVYLTPGVFFTNAPLILPSGVILQGAGPLTTEILLVTGSNCDVIQWSTYHSASQASILGVATSAIGNAFYSQVRDLAVHGDAFHTTVAGYHHGINITTSPQSTTAATDPDFDPLPVISDVIIDACTGDGFYHSGRSGGLLLRVTSEYNNGNGFTLSFDTTALDCLSNKTGITGFYMNHQSDVGSGCKSYNTGQGNTPQWVSGTSYVAGNCVISVNIMYFCILAVSGTTPPASDATHWTALTATSPAAWGDGYYWDSNCSEHAWAAIDSQQNSANNYYMNSCFCVNIQGTSASPNYNAATNPNSYSHIQLISNKECNISLTCSASNSGAGGAYIYNFDKNFFSNNLTGTSDGTETAMFPTGNGGVFTIWNGAVTFLKATPTLFFNVEANSYQNTNGSGRNITQGSGVPTTPAGANPSAGDIYFRIDTPSTANQRMYICTVGGASPTWVGVV